MGVSTEMGTYSGEYVCMHVRICVQIIMFKSVTFQECNRWCAHMYIVCVRPVEYVTSYLPVWLEQWKVMTCVVYV